MKPRESSTANSPTSSSITLTPTTPDDLAAFLPGRNPEFTTDGMTVSNDGKTVTIIKALTARVGTAIIAIGGIARTPDGSAVAFVEADEHSFKRYPVTAHKAAHAIMDYAARTGIRSMIAESLHEREAADRWLTRLGFEEYSKGIFRWAA